jgi:hypothetical protein
MAKKSEHQIKYEAKEYPECFVPCPPFYDICNKAKLDTQKCQECFKKNDFEDCIE